MKEYEQLIVTFIGENNNVILEKEVKNIPLKEDIIISKSIEFFNDPEPCMIHKSAVIMRLYMELYYYFCYMKKNDNYLLYWDEVPENIKQLLNVEGKIKSIVIKSSFAHKK